MKARDPVVDSLPALDVGVNIVRCRADLPVFQIFTGRELYSGGEALWIDVGNEASTYKLSSFGPGDVLERVRIGRAFTPFQHYSLATNAGSYLNKGTELLVMPNIDQIYMAGQTGEEDTWQLFTEMWNHVHSVVIQEDLKLLVSASSSKLGRVVEKSSRKTISLKETSQGFTAESEDFRTRFYRDGKSVQTALPFWQDEEKAVKVEN